MKKVIDGLRAEHKQGDTLVRELERSLMLFEDSWPEGAGEFMQRVNDYADFHWRHMRTEEQQILPAAERVFAAADWKAIDDAFDTNQDPIAGIKERDFHALFSRIVSLAPAPVGFAEPWKKAAGR